MDAEHPGRRALAQLDATLSRKPQPDEAGLRAVTRCLCAFREDLIAGQRGAPGERRRLDHLNAVVSVVMAGHFPLGAVPWDELGRARDWLADLVATIEPDRDPP